MFYNQNLIISCKLRMLGIYEGIDKNLTLNKSLKYTMRNFWQPIKQMETIFKCK